MKLTPAKKRKFQEAVINWYMTDGRPYPWRQTNNPFNILIAELLLRQTGAWKAEKAYIDLTLKYSNPALLSEANHGDLQQIFQPLGLHKRAELIICICKDLNQRFGGQVPCAYPDLISIKGIGRYTANAILCLSFDQKLPLVDGSTSRLFSRHFGIPVKKPAYADKDLWSFAASILPDLHYREFNLGLLDIGAMHCKHPKPICNNCPLLKLCEFESKVF